MLKSATDRRGEKLEVDLELHLIACVEHGAEIPFSHRFRDHAQAVGLKELRQWWQHDGLAHLFARQTPLNVPHGLHHAMELVDLLVIVAQHVVLELLPCCKRVPRPLPEE